ncbi:hypothetical protein [Streptomyces drozdowiczii]|uniref:hypothetical protein n=1 Tax=Streptomyces drozdowiczii TaxID=202862 RepID=UPI00403C4C9C
MTAWSDTDLLMNAIAADVYEQCATHPEQSLTVDDPRNIAAVAAATARLVLGTKEEEAAQLRAEVERLRTNRATVLNEAADAADLMHVGAEDPTPDDHVRGYNNALDHVVTELRRLADEAQQPETEAPRRPGPDDVQVWPLARVLKEVRCGSQDWSWAEEWADLDQRHAASGYLDRLEQEIKANGITLPVLIGSDGRLWDGHHRLRIAVRLGIGYVPVEVTPPAPAPTEEPTR